LEKDGLVRRVHGGALSLQVREDASDYNYVWQSKRCREEKQRIGKLAASLIEDEQTLILDGGSTTAEAARHLVGRRLHVVTNSVPIAQIFYDSRSVEVTLTGGCLYPRLGVLLGPFCERMLDEASADVLIMGTAGVTEAGFSNNNTLIVGSEQKMIEASRRVIIVADHTKFGRNALVHLAPLEKAQVVVSDGALEPRYRTLLEAHGVQLLTA
jgi:DeoR/GlpR family transcriptional regulator of sugar metabolism